MSTFLAWRNALHHKTQAIVSTSSVCAVMVLLYAQLGFYDTCHRSSTLLYDQMDFDALLVSPNYEWLRFTGKIPLRYLNRAQGVPGVSEVTPIYVGNFDFQHQDDARHEVVVLAADPCAQPFRLPDLQRKLPQLQALDSAIVDAIMVGKNMPELHAEDFVQLNGKRLRIIETYRHGAGFIADTVMIVSPETMARLVPGFTIRGVSLGLVQFQAECDANHVTGQLRQLFGNEVLVMSRAEVENKDRHFFLRVKPNGIQFGAGVVLAVSVAIAVLYQLLSSNVLRREREFATLRAIGYSSTQIYRIVLQEALLLELSGLLPATGLAILLYHIIRTGTHLPLFMTWQRVGLVTVLSLLICVVSGFAVTRRLLRRDPADLF